RAAAAGGGAHAAVGLLALAAGSSDPSLQVEAIEQLAPPDGELGAQLAEELAWLWAFGLGDWDRAAEALAAVPAERRKRGALLAHALIQAKRGEPAELGDALAALGGALQEPYPAAALLLRAAAIADVAGDAELALER